MATLPGMVRITLDEYDASLASALLQICIGPQAVLPSLPPALVHEFEGPAKRMVVESQAVLQRAERPNLGLSCELTVAERVHAGRAAIQAIDAVVDGTHKSFPVSAEVLVIGAGLTGLIIASGFSRVGASIAILERTASVGGVWRLGNPHSRVNSTEPAYRMRVHRTHPNTDHSYFFQIIDDMRMLITQANLARSLHLRATVRGVSVSRSGQGLWIAQGNQSIGKTSKRFQLEALEMTILCTNRRLGRPRQLFYENEQEGFRGKVIRGLAGDNIGLPWLGKNVVVIGHGPYAVEQTRTALEHKSAHVMILVRRHGLVCPAILDYLVRQPMSSSHDSLRQLDPECLSIPFTVPP